MVSTDKYILGTVQLGLDYGINNATGKPSQELAHAMLTAAWEQGVRTLDTAEVYGNAHEVIGNFHRANPEMRFNVVTKFLAASILENGAAARLDAVLKELDVEVLAGWMFHNPAELERNPEIVRQLAALKASGKIRHAGVSVYTNEDVIKAAATEHITIVQMPFNLLDNGGIRAEGLAAARAANMVVHVRSVFLQGVFFMDTAQLPQSIQPLLPYLEELRLLAEGSNLQIPQLAMGYPFQHPDIDGVVIGTDNAEQIKRNIAMANTAIGQRLRDQVEAVRVREADMLNPSNWNK